jgi:hypothetical protein
VTSRYEGDQVDDWRYDFLKEDVKRLREDLKAVEKRTWEVESWQNRVPFRIWAAGYWLLIVAAWIAVIAGVVHSALHS